MNSIRVLVTGAGSGVGQGIIKALRISTLPIVIISADISPLNSALYRADEAVIIPKVEDEGALSRIISVLKEKSIDILMVGSEFDLEFFAKNKPIIEEATNTLIVTSPLNTVNIAGDKFLTAEFLRENYLPYAISYLPSSTEDALIKADDLGYPVVLKDRCGTSSKNVYIIKNQVELSGLFKSVPNPMLQQYIAKGGIENEYTCSVFKCKDGSILGPFTARRSLRGGSSWVIEVGSYSHLFPLLLSIGEKLPMTGSINIQLMEGKDGPIPFEFNARFSGTTAVRAYYGFNEPEMFIRNYYLNEKLVQPSIRKGLSFRYLEEIFLENLKIEDLGCNFPKGVIEQWF